VIDADPEPDLGSLGGNVNSRPADIPNAVKQRTFLLRYDTLSVHSCGGRQSPLPFGESLGVPAGNQTVMRITLAVTEGPNTGLTFTFDRHHTFVVGRSPEAHFVLPEDDRYFSRLHFLVEVNPPLCRLVDLRSHNGTCVNGAKVDSAELKDGDLINAGHSTLRVALEVDQAGPEPAPSTPPADPWPTLSIAPRREEPALAGPASKGFPRIPGYQILRELGRGNMGLVYQARRLSDESIVALKTVLPAVQPTPAVLKRFLREVDILRGLDHPAIVRFLDSGVVDERLFFVMEFVAGTDAGVLLESQGPLPVAQVVELGCQLLEALAYAHAQGIVHRDVKPSNLLVAAEPGRSVLKLSDFGLARAYQESPLSGLTITGSSGGTPAFMAPEQILDFRGVRPAADQYTAAATLYRLLTDRPLYDGVTSARDLMAAILTKEPVPLQQRRPGLPAPLVEAIERALARQAERRFPDVTAFRQALLAAADKC
jgi:serine/threonine-protein kinase